MGMINVNADLSQLPQWVLGALLVALVGLELLDQWQPEMRVGLPVDECVAVCQGEVAEFSVYLCRCQEAKVDEDGSTPSPPPKAPVLRPAR